MTSPNHAAARPSQPNCFASRWRTLVVFFHAIALCTPVLAQGSQSVKIGWIGPLTGASADFGIPMRNGVRLAVQEINAAGGYLGRKLEIVIRDDEANPEVGMRAAEELVREGVSAAIGFCNTGVALKAAPIFQNAKTVLMVPCSTGTPVTTQFPSHESYIFRTAPRDAIQAPFVVDYILQRGWKRVAIFADTTPYGEAGLQDVVKALAAHKLAATSVVRFALGVKDLTQEMRQARAAGAQVIFSYTVGPENAVIAKSRASIGWDVTQVGAWPLSFPFFIDGAGPAAEGALMSQTFIAEPSNERRLTFLNAYKKAFGTSKISVPMAAAQAYDATYILAHAILSIRDTSWSGADIKRALENLDRPYYGVIGTYDHPFSDSDHEAISPNMLVMGTVKNGAVTFADVRDRSRSFVTPRKVGMNLAVK